MHMKIMNQAHGFFLHIPAVLQKNAPLVAYEIFYIADLVDFQILGVYSSILAINHVTLCKINIDI